MPISQIVDCNPDDDDGIPIYIWAGPDGIVLSILYILILYGSTTR